MRWPSCRSRGARRRDRLHPVGGRRAGALALRSRERGYGRPRAAPHRADANGSTVTLVVFDDLAVGGEDVRGAPWSERRARLEDLLGGAEGAVRLTPVLDLNAELHDAVVADGWECTVAKRTTGRYRCGKRSSAWVKLKSPAARDRDRRRFLASLVGYCPVAPPGATAGVNLFGSDDASVAPAAAFSMSQCFLTPGRGSVPNSSLLHLKPDSSLR
jgi:ATP dependent DNA ligase-like protein